MKRICDGNHGKLGMVGCLDPRRINGEWVCPAPKQFNKFVRKMAEELIDDEQTYLDAHWEAGVSWKDGDA